MEKKHLEKYSKFHDSSKVSQIYKVTKRIVLDRNITIFIKYQGLLLGGISREVIGLNYLSRVCRFNPASRYQCGPASNQRTLNLRASTITVTLGIRDKNLINNFLT